MSPPPGHRRRGERSERSPTSSLSTPRTASSDSAQRGDGAKPGALFRLEVTADGPIWPLGAPRARRATYSQIPDHYAHAGNSGTPMMGDPGLEPGNLFLIRKAFCLLQSCQLAVNPCKSRNRRSAEDDWRRLAATTWWPHRGPTTAVRGQGVGWPGSEHHADDTANPGRAGGGPLRACKIASTATSLGAWSSSSITCPYVSRVSQEPWVDLPRDIQPSARHAASTASLVFVPQRRRGCEETGAAGELVASQPSTVSREIRGERPT